MTGVVTYHSAGENAWKLRFALLLSVFVHTLGGIAATQLSVEGGGPARGQTFAWKTRAAPAMSIDWAAPPLEEPPPPAPPAVEPVEQASPEPPPPIPEPDRLRLGIEDSDQRTNNVIGFKEPTPHSAPDVGVDQPALDPEAGSPAPGAPTPPVPPSAGPDTAPTPAMEALPTVFEQGPPRPPEVLADPTPPEPELKAGPKGDAPIDQPEKPEVTGGKPDLPDRPITEGPTPGSLDPQAAQPAKTKGEEVKEPSDGADAETKPAREEVKPPPPKSPPSGSPEVQAPASPAPPNQPPGAAPTNDPLQGLMLGERSEKEADPSSKEKPIEVVLGHPAAGQGLEIITKRPRRNPFSLVTRVLALPNNPVVEVNFDRLGRVSTAKIIRSSGVSDVDSPVLAAVYGWRAKGKRLESLSPDDPNAAITVTVTILLR